MITLQFVACSDPASEAIKLFERGWPSHVDCVLPDGHLLGARIDGGVLVRQANYEVWDKSERISLTTSEDTEAKFYAFLRAQIGKPYDKLAIAAFAVERDWRTPDSWFCSELQAAALEACGFFPHPLANSVNEITPRDLLLICSPWATLV